MASSDLRVGAIKNISGEVNIAGGDIYAGYTADQVSILIQQITSTFQPKEFDGRCPYKGLYAFEEEDAGLFFGREKVVDELIERVQASRAVFITGPSGSGKSSLVRAGLIHALKQGTIKDRHSEGWLYQTMKPGRDPISELARVASGIAGTLSAGDDIRTKGLGDATVFAQWCEIALKDSSEKRAVLFIDQFEELFTQISNETERLAFLNMVTHAPTAENGRVIVLFCMRSDFVSNCATYPQVNALLNQQFMQIGAMQPDELVSAIAQPALRVGLRIDPDLIAQIINDMQGEPGTLPLMQFALKDLFDSEQATGGIIALTREAYLQRGGIHKALERHADDAFSKLSASEQELAHSIFSGLIEIGRGTQDTRRTALFDELIPANAKAQDVEGIVQRLADARLITTDEQAGKETVTISHEKLIDAWPWLKKLVNENRDAIALQNQISSDAKEWDDNKRDSSYLYTGARLINAREQLAKKELVLSGLAQEFVQAGSARQRHAQIIRIIGVSAVIGLVILGIIIYSYQSTANSKRIAEQSAAFASTQSAIASTAQADAEEAQRQARIARAGELVAQSIALRERNFPLSSLLGIEAYRTLGTVQARGAVLDNAQAHPQLIQYLARKTYVVNSVAFSPDGKTLASGNGDGTIILWDVATRQPIGQPLSGHTNAVASVAFSPDGKTLASGSYDQTIILWDLATGRPIGQPFTGHISTVSSVSFSPDGKMLASGSYDHTIILWDIATHQRVGSPLAGHANTVSSVAFSPDGKMLASGSADRTIILWDLATRQPIGLPLAGHANTVSSVAFSPDGKMLASGSADRTIILWDIAAGKPIGQPLIGHTDGVFSVDFSADGKMLASGSADKTIILWDVATHQPIGQPLTGHTNTVNSVAFNPIDGGKTLASGSADSTLVLWKVAASEPLTGHTDAVWSVAFSPDGKILASGSKDKTIKLWDVATGKPIGQPLTGHTDFVWSVTFSPDGKMLASGSRDKTIVLWDVATRKPIGQPLTGHTDAVWSVAFSPDGKTLASGSKDNTIILWDVATRQPIGQPLKGHTDGVFSVAFSPDGKTLASGSADSTIILWDVSTHQPIGQRLRGHTSWVCSVAFSPDGKTLASGSWDNTIKLWDVATHQAIGQPLTGHTDAAGSVAFSPLDGGKTLASGSWDKTIILWDVATHQPIGQPLTGHSDQIWTVAFSPDGKTLASGSNDKTIMLWDMNVQSWIDRTCQRVGRNFTQVEWHDYFPSEEYRVTCPQWPAAPGAEPTPIPTP